MDSKDNYLTPKQVAHMAYCHVRTIHRRLNSGVFPNARRNGTTIRPRYLIPDTDAVAYVKTLYTNRHRFCFNDFVYWAGVVRPATLDCIREELDWQAIDTYLAEHPTDPDSNIKGEDGLDEWEREDKWINELIGFDHETWARQHNVLFRQDPFVTLPCAHGCSYDPEQAGDQPFEEYVTDRNIECNIGDIAELMIRDYLGAARTRYLLSLCPPAMRPQA